MLRAQPAPVNSGGRHRRPQNPGYRDGRLDRGQVPGGQTGPPQGTHRFAVRPPGCGKKKPPWS